jgi:selenocysteine-specific translation elongation factor
MSDYAIINISKLDTFLGEQLVAVDIFGIKRGFILHSYEIDAEKIRNIIKNTGLSSFVILDNLDQLKSAIADLGQEQIDGAETDFAKEKENEKEDGVCVSIDHAFDVKGVGTVVLGSVRQGAIKPYDELVLYPADKPIMIKSIQMHDDPVDISKKPSRVGLALKGVSGKDISRGDIIASSGLAKIAYNDLQVKFIKNQFFKEDLSETQNYMISVGLQIRTVKIKQIADSNLNITFEKPLAYVRNEKCVLFRPDSKGMRIMGYGIIIE